MKERNLDLLFDQERRVQPLIDVAHRRLEKLRATAPAVLALAGKGDVRQAWQALDLQSQRTIIRALAVPPRVQSRGGHPGTQRATPRADQDRMALGVPLTPLLPLPKGQRADSSHNRTPHLPTQTPP